MKKVLYIFLVLLLSNCSNIQRDYKNAEKENSIDAYREFIQKYKDHSLADSAHVKIEYLLFQNAINTNNADSIKNFLNHYPETKLKNKALYYIDSLLFEQVLTYNNSDSIESFINQYPESVFLDQAHKKNEEIVFDNANKNNSISEFKKYIRKFPNGKFINEAKAKISELKISKALSIAKKQDDNVMVASGRLLDINKKPLKDKEVYILAFTDKGEEFALAMYRTENPRSFYIRPPKTDDQGLFVLMFDAISEIGLGLGNDSKPMYGSPGIYKMFYLPAIKKNTKHIDFGDIIVDYRKSKVTIGDIKVDNKKISMSKKEYTFK